jgi:hypothetical protein
MHRTTLLIPALLGLTAPIGCTTIRSHNADFSQFQQAESLMLSDHGPGNDTAEKRSATIKDFKTIAEVIAIFNSSNAHWQPVQGDRPVPRFTLSAFRDGHLADWLWFGAPAGKEGNVYVQMKFSRGEICFTYISQADFDKLLKLFGTLQSGTDAVANRQEALNH